MADQSVAPVAPAPGLPDRAKAFLLAIGVATAAVALPAIGHGGPTRGWLAFAVLVAGASVAQLFAFHTIRNQVFHTTPLFFVAGIILLPPQLLILLPLISHVPDWLRKRYAWYIQTFNILNFTLAITAAWGVDRLVTHALSGHSDGWAAGAAAAVLVYVVLNNGCFAIILYLARGHSPRDILNPATLSADAALACLGIALAHFWQMDPWLIPFAIVPLALLHSALHLPQLREEARMDAKTGLANARHFTETLTEELTRARRFSRPLSVIVADLDLLRNVNNTYGHLAGDAVLAGVAEIIRSHVRHYDVAARFGGEEFAIVLPETTELEAWETAERIREAVAGTPIWAESAGQYVNVTLSMGVAAFPSHGTDPDDLLHHADIAAYHAKLQGRNRAFRASRRARLTAVAGQPLIAAIVREDDRPRESWESRVAERSATSNIVVGAVGALGIVAGVVASVLGSTPDLRALLVVGALVAVGQVFALEIDNGTISAGAVAALAGVAMFGFRAALLLAAIGVVMDVATRRWRPAFAFVTLGARTLGLLAAAGVFALGFGGTAGDVLKIALGAVAGALSFLVVSAILDLGLVFEGGEPGVRSWRERFSWLTPHYAVYGFVAAVAALAWRHAGLYALVAFAATLLAIRKTQEAVVTQARKNAQNLRQAAEMIQTQNLSLERVSRLLKERSTSAMESLSSIVDRRDSYTAGHARRVCDLVLAMGRELGLSAAELDILRDAALFHDIGKLTVPDAILLKPGALSDVEWGVMRRHPDEGARIIERLGFLDDAVPAIRHHHERIDGEGYPRGLIGDQIPLGARIIHVADAYDSMRTNRVYQAARSDVDALAELRRLAGKQFCPVSVAALEKAIDNGTFGAKRDGNAKGRSAQTAS